MKKIISLLFLSILLVCCDQYDDTAIKEKLDSQDARIEALAAEIAELGQIVDAMKAGDYVTGVEPIIEGGVTVGITVTFHSSPSATILFSTGGSGNGISSAVLEGSVLVITLTSGETVRLPVTTVPVIVLAKDTVLVFAGGNGSVGYTVTGGDAGNSVQLFVEGLWSAEAVPGEAGAGSITLTAPNPCSDAKVVAVVTSAAGLSSFKTLVCREALFSVAKASYGVASDAGQLKVAVVNNIGAYTVDIPTEATWISTVSAAEDELTLAFEENTGSERQATVKLKNEAYQAEISFKIVQEDGGTFVWKPISEASQVVAGSCIIAWLRESDSKLFFLASDVSLTRNPSAADATAAGVTFDGSDINAVKDSYEWKVSASGTNWNFAGKNGLYLIGCDKNQGVAVLANLNGQYQSTNTYSRDWYFVNDADHGLQMKVTESATRYLSIPTDYLDWRMLPELNGKIVLYYKTRL